jgi:hypothetical protein
MQVYKWISCVYTQRQEIKVYRADQAIPRCNSRQPDGYTDTVGSSSAYECHTEGDTTENRLSQNDSPKQLLTPKQGV